MTPDELRRLIEIVAEELTAAAPAAPVARRCLCHAVSLDCCPDRLQGVIDAGATRVGVYAAGGAPADVAGLIDHTLLKPDATRQDIVRSWDFRWAPRPPMSKAMRPAAPSSTAHAKSIW
jgi:hypothetical protein